MRIFEPNTEEDEEDGDKYLKYVEMGGARFTLG
jgi:hypothetical protein